MGKAVKIKDTRINVADVRTKFILRIAHALDKIMEEKDICLKNTCIKDACIKDIRLNGMTNNTESLRLGSFSEFGSSMPKDGFNISLDVSEREYDTFSFRLRFVRGLTKGCGLPPLTYSDAETDTRIRRSVNGRNSDFEKVMEAIGGKLEYMTSGSNGHTFKGGKTLPDGSVVNYGVKISAFPKKDVRIDAELLMIKTLSYFVAKGQTPHIALPITTFDTDIKQFTDFVDRLAVPPKNDNYDDFKRKYDKGHYKNGVSVLISEWANRGDFYDFVSGRSGRLPSEHWKVFFFQIVSVLAVIQSKYPGFRHNDLKPNNVLVHEIKRRSKTDVYSVCGRSYVVPNIGYILKIWDFDFACIPGVVRNSKVEPDWTSKINVLPKKNRYYDMHYFFNSLGRWPFFHEFMKNGCIPIEAQNFIKRVVPKEYRKHKKGQTTSG